MALESCFHVCTVSSNARACVIPKFNLPTCKGLKSSSSSSLNFLTSSSSSSSSSSSLLRAVNPSRRRSQVVCKAQEAVDVVRVVTDASWNNLVIANEMPVLVEFWAPWCGPCRMIAPVIDEMAKEYAGKISCYKLNTDDCPTIATQYGIRSIPTVLVFKNGEKKESVIGAVPKSTLTSTVEKYLET